jgi:hypothetical protein
MKALEPSEDLKTQFMRIIYLEKNSTVIVKAWPVNCHYEDIRPWQSRDCFVTSILAMTLVLQG